MIPCGPSQHNLPKSALQFALNFTAVVVLATPAFAQAVPKYDAATETILKVAVQELKFVPPTGAKPAAYLVTKSGPDAVQIFLCPKSFLDTIGAEFKAGDEIQVTGSKVKQDGADLILAREVAKAETP